MTYGLSMRRKLDNFVAFTASNCFATNRRKIKTRNQIIFVFLNDNKFILLKGYSFVQNTNQ